MDFIQLYIIANFRIHVLYISTHYSFHLYIFMSLHLSLQLCLPVFISRYKWFISTPKPRLWGSTMRQGGPSFMTTSLLDPEVLVKGNSFGISFSSLPCATPAHHAFMTNCNVTHESNLPGAAWRATQMHNSILLLFSSLPKKFGIRMFPRGLALNSSLLRVDITFQR